MTFSVTREEMGHWWNFESLWIAGQFTGHFDSSDDAESGSTDKASANTKTKKLVHGKGKERAVSSDSEVEEWNEVSDGGPDDAYENPNEEQRKMTTAQGKALALKFKLKARKNASSSRWVDVSDSGSSLDIENTTPEDVVRPLTQGKIFLCKTIS